MQLPKICIDHFPAHQVLREDDHRLKISSYFQIHQKNFEFGEYNHGTQEMKERYKIGKKLYRYFNKRNYLFSRFEQGIEIDEESWYSVIPQAVSIYLRQRFQEKKVKRIFEPFCGIGGIAIHLCDSFEEYIVNDIDPKKIKMLQHNMQVYKKSLNRLKFINSDFLAIEPFQTDALIICPPWGGIETGDYATQDLDSLMCPKLSDILIHAQKFAGEMLLQLPKQTNLGNLIRVIQSVGLRPIFTVEKIMTNDKCSQLFFYLGSESFIGINNSQLYNVLYRDLQKSNQKVDKKRVKALLKTSPASIMAEVYQSHYPK